MKIFIAVLVLSFTAHVQAASNKNSWQLTQAHRQAYALETGRNPRLAMFFRCSPMDSPCNLMLSLPIDCENASGKVAEIPIKLGKKDDVAHLTCMGTGPKITYSAQGSVKVRNVSRLKGSDDAAPVSMDFYSWAVSFPNHKLGAVPDLNAEKKITFVIGGGKHSFSLKKSHEAFQKVYEASVGTGASD